MDDQYPKLVIDSRVARRQLAQEFESGVDSKTQRRVSPVRNRRLATAPQKNASEGKAPCRDLVRSIASLIHRTRSRKTQSDIPKRDISGFGFLLILMLLCEIAAAQTDNPVFWLLVGPTPLALAFTANRFLPIQTYTKRLRKNGQPRVITRTGNRSTKPSTRSAY